MKYSMRWLVGLAACCYLAYASQASAGSVTLTDNGAGSQTVNYVFPSQTSVTTCAGQDTCPYGNSPPDITTVTVEWDDATHALTKITITSTNAFPSGFNSLFINNNYTGNTSDLESWDYYLLTSSDAISRGYYVNSGQTLPAGNGLYKVTENFDPSMYTTATTGRVGHANGIEAVDLTQLFADSTNPAQSQIVQQTDTNTLVYDFSSLGGQHHTR